MAKPPMRRPQATARPNPTVAFKDDDMEKKFPNLYAMLTDVTWEDGSQRRTSTLLFFVEDGTMKACLNDRDQGLTGWISADSLAGLLDALETALADDRLDWRRSDRTGGKGKKAT